MCDVSERELENQLTCVKDLLSVRYYSMFFAIIAYVILTPHQGGGYYYCPCFKDDET